MTATFILSTLVLTLVVWLALSSEICAFICSNPGRPGYVARQTSLSQELVEPLSDCQNMETISRDASAHWGRASQHPQAVNAGRPGFSRHRSSQSTNNASAALMCRDLQEMLHPHSLMHSPLSINTSVAPPSLSCAVEEPASLLTALASQERRVMELREELKKAEEDLSKLKNSWTANEIRRGHDNLVCQSAPLATMSSYSKETTSSAPCSASILEDRRSPSGSRRQTLESRIRPVPRRFEGGKHARALSLLSINSTYMCSSVNSPRQKPSYMSDLKEDENTPKVTPEKTYTKPTVTHVRASESLGRREDFVNTGKQFVGDLKDGLWTFFEDLKQATVGEEAVSEARARTTLGTPATQLASCNKVVTSTLRRNQSSNGQTKYAPNRFSKLPLLDKQPVEGDHDLISSTEAVSDEDTGFRKGTTESTNVHAPFESVQSTPRTNLSSNVPNTKNYGSSFDQINWPSLERISPSRISQTASSLLQEWERSIKEPSNSVVGQP